MKLDIELIKTILKAVQERGDRVNIKSLGIDGLMEFVPNYDDEKKEDTDKVLGHFHFLIDEGFIEGTVGNIATSHRIKDLTLWGHQLLESIENDNIWNKIKNITKEVTKEGIKQMPALALGLLLKMAG